MNKTIINDTKKEEAKEEKKEKEKIKKLLESIKKALNISFENASHCSSFDVNDNMIIKQGKDDFEELIKIFK